MEEIFNNLISNAVNSFPAGGKRPVTAKSLEEYVAVQVEDGGVYVPPEKLPKIFEKFYRAKHPNTRKVVGAGLSLPIVQSAVEPHQGAIHVESCRNQGTAFTVFLLIH